MPTVPVIPGCGVGLREARTRANLTQEALVARMALPGVNAVTLSHWEHGRRVPGPQQLLCWIQVIEPTPDQTLLILGQLSHHPSRLGQGYQRLIASWGGIDSAERIRRFWEWLRV